MAAAHQPHKEQGTQLSGRETEIMRLIRDGSSTKMAAVEMGIGLTTAKEYRDRAYKKLGAHNTAQALGAFAMTQIGDTTS
ncbi:response regulator transcription factor [Frondihabitans sp. VKM Ac-2883]|uniref:response regulator transcription factor n=1 Tax=Frondihabitans sp. VKM Ac-2883 TaxID=2783823 RepID=UPI00188A6B07|nr:helix-turn-helix transcriptional regulator [Frondihabitans sp. VKM Ac-2883]MBF4574694.1 helix-turn-helix transcriptional regulator [Frondihabitans sp. VKM Ac-2883]